MVHGWWFMADDSWLMSWWYDAWCVDDWYVDGWLVIIDSTVNPDWWLMVDDRWWIMVANLSPLQGNAANGHDCSGWLVMAIYWCLVTDEKLIPVRDDWWWSMIVNSAVMVAVVVHDDEWQVPMSNVGYWRSSWRLLINDGWKERMIANDALWWLMMAAVNEWWPMMLDDGSLWLRRLM